MNILVPVLRRTDLGLFPWKITFIYSKEERERNKVAEELWHLMGTTNPNSSLHKEDNPDRSNSHLLATFSQLPLYFLVKVREYANKVNQHDRDVLQMCLRYLRSAKDYENRIIPKHRVRMVELYLDAIPVFDAITSGSPYDIAYEMLNHCERSDWEAHKRPYANMYPTGYFFYTCVWERVPLPSREDLVWLNDNAFKLAKYRSVLEQRPFNKGLCEQMLANSNPVVSSGAL